VNFLVQVPIALALGFDKPSTGLMERKPRPLTQPVLSRNQWARLIFLGVIIAAGTLLVEAYFTPIGTTQAITTGFVVFSLFNVALGLEARSENDTIFSREFFSDVRQLELYGLAVLVIFLGTELGFLQRFFGTTSLTGDQWRTCILVALVLVVVEEVIKFFRRRASK